jgi:hypothetical protein
MKRAVIGAVLGFVLIMVAAIAWPIIRVRQLEKSFSEVIIGDTKDLVLKRMGTPWKDEECGKYQGGITTGCVEEFVYAHPYAPYAPEYWDIEFDSNNQVISNIQLTSP